MAFPGEPPFISPTDLFSGANISGPWPGLGQNYAQYLTFLAPLLAFLPRALFSDAIWLVIMGAIIEMGRRLFFWCTERFRFQYYLTAQFRQGDPAHEWMVNFLAENEVWRSTCEFEVTAKNSVRKWGIMPARTHSFLAPSAEGNADYVPQYSAPLLFRWKGYWVEIKRETTESPGDPGRRQAMMSMGIVPMPMSTLSLKIYTRHVAVLSDLVEQARSRYLEVCKPHVLVHIADLANIHTPGLWSNVKRRPRRPISTVILGDGVMDGLVDDLKDFLASEKLYHEAGIPHRRGILLEGPPGTGKTSTICSIAGELGLEVFSLSLSAGFLDDMGLQSVVSSTPRGCILVIEDIDCAFATASREDDDEEEDVFDMDHYISPQGVLRRRRKTAVTLSGLLNVIDGIGSDEGKIFFTTTNYVERLDSALLRPGRIDRRIRYHLATQAQALAMFRRFFPAERLVHLKSSPLLDDAVIKAAAERFATAIPEDEFTTAELQGFLLGYKNSPLEAARDITPWVEAERSDKTQREEREKLRKEKVRQEARKRRERQYFDYPGTARSSAMLGSPPPPFNMVPHSNCEQIPGANNDA